METNVLPKQTSIPPQRKEVRIFVVDDNLTYLMALGSYLKTNPYYRIYCYRSGEECIENMNIDPDVVILDYYLNDGTEGLMNGIEILKTIKKMSPGISVIILSEQKSLEVAVNTLNEGAFTYVPKNKQAFPAVQKTIAHLIAHKTH